MNLFAKTKENAKSIPKTVWIISLVLPLGFTFVIGYVAAKTFYKEWKL